MASSKSATKVTMTYDPGITCINHQMNDGVDTVARKLFEDKLKLTLLYITRLDTYLREKFWSENNIPYEVSIASPVWIYCKDTRIVVLIEKISLLCQRILENVCKLRLQYDALYKYSYEASTVEWLINTEIRILQYKKTGQFQEGNIFNLKMAVIDSIEDTIWESTNVIVKVPRLIVYDATLKSYIAARRIEIEKSAEESRRRKEYWNKIPAWIEYVVTNLQVAKEEELQVNYEICQDILPRGKTDPWVDILELSYNSYTFLDITGTSWETCQDIVNTHKTGSDLVKVLSQNYGSFGYVDWKKEEICELLPDNNKHCRIIDFATAAHMEEFTFDTNLKYQWNVRVSTAALDCRTVDFSYIENSKENAKKQFVWKILCVTLAWSNIMDDRRIVFDRGKTTNCISKIENMGLENCQL